MRDKRTPKDVCGEAIVCADSTNFLGVSLLNSSFRSESRVTHALERCVRVVFSWHFSDGILFIQRTIVENLTKTMEIIIDSFLICKYCDIMI